jgi:hypothetical protein
METTCGTGLNSGTSLKKLTPSLAEKSIERISELSADAQIRRPEVVKDSCGFNRRTETVVDTPLWLENFTTFLGQLCIVA